MSILVLNFPELVDNLQFGNEYELIFDTQLGLILPSETFDRYTREADEEDESDADDVDALTLADERYLVLSIQTSREEYNDMCNFANCVRKYDPALAEMMDVALDGLGAFRRFRGVLSPKERQSFRNWWYSYRDWQVQERLINWLKMHRIAFDEENSVYVKEPLPPMMRLASDADIQQLTLVLIYLTCNATNIKDGGSAWKGYEWSALDALKEKGWIDFQNRNKTLNLTQTGVCEAEKLLSKYGIPARQ
jgi:hypothetical protein